MQIELRSPSSIKAYESNPRVNDGAVDAVAASIQTFGFRVPIVVDEHGVVVCGHTRLRAAMKMNLAEVPVHVATGLTPEQIRAYRIADNQTASIAEWDKTLLPLELFALKEMDFDLSLLGFPADDLARWLGADTTEGLTDPDAIPEPPTELTTRLGDVWLLGHHRLMCGDSTNEADVARLMNGEKADLFATDPPYLVNYDGNNHPQNWKDRPSKNKDWSDTYNEQGWDDEAQGEEFLFNFLSVAFKVAVIDNPAIYVWHASRRQAMLERAMERNGILVHQQILWFKTRPVLTRCTYLWQHEPCFFGWIRGKKPKTNIPNGSEWNRTVWQIPSREVECSDHPTSKPVRIFTIPMEHHTVPNDLCYEPFSGSGSQLIAAEQTGRRCYAMELSPSYVEVAVQRWQDFTGKQAILERTGDSPIPLTAQEEASL